MASIVNVVIPKVTDMIIRILLEQVCPTYLYTSRHF